MGKLTVKIDGMRCESCRRRTIAAIKAINGAAARVSLERKKAVVSFEQQLTADFLQSSIISASRCFPVGYSTFVHKDRSSP